MAIRLIVGLGNPGKDYQSHRHNVGFWFVDSLVNLYSGKFKKESKFFGDVTQISIDDSSIRLLKPNTYINQSGKAIASIANFYQLQSDEILIVHDELDLPPGTVKIKLGGGHGGHNGLRDAISSLGSKDFYRLRIGIGHPGDKSKVTNFVLHSPSKSEFGLIQTALVNSLAVIEKMINGDIENAMNILHTQK